MVRETRHLWVGNLPDNIREDRIREHFKRYGRVQNVKLLGRPENAAAGAVPCPPTTGTGAVSGVCATVAFMDIKSASKAHNAEHVLDERTLTTEYYEPAAIPTAGAVPSAGSSPAGSGYSGSSSSVNSAPAPASTTAPVISTATASRYHLSSSGGEEGPATCALAATAAAPANWRGTNDSATEYSRRGNTPAAAAFPRYQRNNSAPYATPPTNVDRCTPHHRWYTGGGSTPSTPGGARRRRGSHSSRSSRSSSSSGSSSRASSPAPAPPPRSPPAPWATAGGRPLAICVRNLPARSTDTSLKDGLYHEYKKHGKVMWVKVVGQNSDRYAVVRFKKPSDVEKALEVSQDKLFFGCKISVAPHQSCDEDADSAKPYETDIDEYHPKATRTLFIGNLEKDVTQQQLRDKFKHFGRIIEIDIKKGSGGGAGYAFCQYASISSVVEAIRAMDGEHVGGARVKLGFGKPVATTCVWLDGLTEHTEKQVLQCVARSGAATSVCVDRAAGAALVHFEQAAAAGAAVRDLRRVAALAHQDSPAADRLDRPRLAVDYASRECQEAFYDQLEKHGGSAALTSSERLSGDLTTRYLPSTRLDPIRYEGCNPRSRASSYSRTPSRTPRYAALEHYDPEYTADRRYRVYDELGTSPQTEEAPYEERLQSVVVSPHRARRHRRDSTPGDRKHSKERHRSVTGVVIRRSRSGSRCGERHSGRRRHRRRRDGSGSRAGTPLRDEPDGAPCEPRRLPCGIATPRAVMSLPLPKFALQLLRHAPPAPRPQPAPAPDSPRPPSASSSSAGSAPHSPSLEERIRSLDEKYEKWSGSRALPDAADRARLRHRLLDLDINEVKPSEVVRSLLAKRSVFDEDSERLEGAARAPSPQPPPPPPRAPRHVATPTSATSAASAASVSSATDPRLNRPDKPYFPERLGKFSDIDYGRLESRIRLRTPSIDRPQPDAPDRRQSPRGDREKPDIDKDHQKDIERRRKISVYGARDCENKFALGAEEKEIKEAIESIDPDFHGRDDKCSLQDKPKIETEEINLKSSVELMSTNIVEVIREKPTSLNENDSNHGEDKILNQEVKEKIKETEIIEQLDEKLEPDNSSSQQKNVTPENPQSVEESKPDVKIQFNEKCKEILVQNHINKDHVEFEIPHSHLNTPSSIKQSKEFTDLSHEIMKSYDKNGKDRHTQNMILEAFHTKLEKENIEFENSTDVSKYSSNALFQNEKKASEMDKNVEDRNRNERDKARHNKDRVETEKTDHVKDRSRTHKNEKLDKDKKSKDESFIERPHSEKIDKTKIEKDNDKVHKEKHDREPEKPRHLEDKSSRHDHHRKDRSEKDKRKDSHTSHDKKEEKHKHEKCKKDNSDTKRDKKDTDQIKSRKSSKDESSRDLYRKDSTDSSTSRASHDSSKQKEFEVIETKEDSKSKAKYFNNTFIKQEIDKDFPTTPIDSIKLEGSMKIKTEIKEEKVFPEKYSKVKTENEVDIFKCKTEITEKQRHYSLDSPSVECKRKERLNSCSSLPSTLGQKRRMSSQESIELATDDAKKSRNEMKCPERRDSKDSRSADRHKPTKFNKGHFAKLIESKTKDDKKNQVKTQDETCQEFKDIHTKDPMKVNAPVDSYEEKQHRNTDLHQEGLHNDLDFLATLELRSSEEDERQKALRKEMKEKKRIQQLQQIQELQMQHDAMQQAELMGKMKDDKKHKNDEKRKEAAREKRMSTDRKSREEKSDSAKRKNRKHLNSTDTSDSDEPKKHSIFDIIDDEPTYISMYDKVKARSCKNMQKQEEEKRQEKIKAKFCQLKQSRAKREEKKRSSWDEDSDSENDRRKSTKTSSSEDDHTEHKSKKPEKSHCSFDYDRSKSNDLFSPMTQSAEEDSHNKLSRKNSRSRIISDTSDDDRSKRSLSKSPSFLTTYESFQRIRGDDLLVKNSNDQTKKNSLLNLFGVSDSDDSKLKSSLDSMDNKTCFGKTFSNDFSSENDSMSFSRTINEIRKKHKKKQKKYKSSLSDDETKMESSDTATVEGEGKHKHSEKLRRHSTHKKERRKDKTRDSLDADESRDDRMIMIKKDKKLTNNSFDSLLETSYSKKDEKMEDIFGPLSDDSDKEIGQNNKKEFTHSFDSACITNHQMNVTAINEQNKASAYKEDSKRRKEKRRKERRLILKEDENSLDVDAVSRAIEARLFAESMTDEDIQIKMDLPNIKNQQSEYDYPDDNTNMDIGKTSDKINEKTRKECREKRKKKKKNREDRLSRREHHHLNHTNKNDYSFNEPVQELSKSMLLDIPLPSEMQDCSAKSENCPSLTESPSLPRLTDSPPVIICPDDSNDTKTKDYDTTKSPSTNKSIEYTVEKEIEVTDIPMPPSFENIVQDISEVPLPKDPIPNKLDHQAELFAAPFSDVGVSEDAVRSISNLEKDTDKPTDKVEPHNKAEKKTDEKPRAIISQEETADAVAALLGESFGEKADTFANCYEESEINPVNQIEVETSPVVTENILEEDAEEMRRAVQNLNASEMEMKPDTPVSDSDLLLIDTDTEEADDATPDAVDRLPVNIIAANQNLNTPQTLKSSEISHQKTLPHQQHNESKEPNAKIKTDVKVTLPKRDPVLQIASTATPVITSWTLSNNKQIEPHLVNVQSKVPNRDANEIKPKHVTANIVQVKGAQNQSIGTTLRPMITPNRVNAPYQVINHMIRPQTTNIQPPTIKIPEQHLYQKQPGMVISPRMSSEPRQLSPKISPQGEGVHSSRLANVTILNTTTQTLSSVGLSSPNSIQQRSPGQVTVVRMQQPPLSPIQTMHLPSHGGRPLISPSRPNSVLVQAQGAPIHFNRLPVTPVLAPISKQINASNIIAQQGKNVVSSSQMLHQQRIITADTRKIDQRNIVESANEKSKIILSPTNLQHSTNPTVMAQNRLISMQNALSSGNFNSTLHLANKVVVSNMSRLSDKRENHTSKSDLHNHISYGTAPIIHVAGIKQSQPSIIQSGSRPVMCTIQDANPFNKGQGPNVIHALNTQRLLTTAPISNFVQMDAYKPSPSVLSMAAIRAPTVLTKLDSSRATAATTTCLSNVVMTPLLLKTSTTPTAFRLGARFELEQSEKQDGLKLINHKNVNEITSNESLYKLKEDITPTDSLPKSETDFEELLKDTTNEIKVTSNPENKLEVNIGKTAVEFSAHSKTQQKIDVGLYDKEIHRNSEPVAEKSVLPVQCAENKETSSSTTMEAGEANNSAEQLLKTELIDGSKGWNEGQKLNDMTVSQKNEGHTFLNVTTPTSDNEDNQLRGIDENDSWSAKDVNIESVIKKVDSLCNIDADIKDVTGQIIPKDTDLSRLSNPLETHQDSKPMEIQTDPENNPDDSFEKVVGATKRGGRNVRGKRSEKNQDRVQTRQIVKPPRGGASKRGRGRAKIDKKIKAIVSPSANNIPGDVYDFHEDSGDESTSPNKTEARPRLILTIKSPHSAHSNVIPTSTLSIAQKELKIPDKVSKDEKPEDFVSPSANTRKSRRLQEKDGQKSNDDIDETVKGKGEKDGNKKRQTRQAGVKANQTEKVGSDTRKSPRGVKRTRDRSLSNASIDSSDEKIKRDDIPKDSKVGKLSSDQPAVAKMEVEIPKNIVPVAPVAPVVQPVVSVAPPVVSVAPVVVSQPSVAPTPIMKPPKKMISEISAKLAGVFQAAAATPPPARVPLFLPSGGDLPPARVPLPLPSGGDLPPPLREPRDSEFATIAPELMAAATGDVRAIPSVCAPESLVPMGAGGEALSWRLEGAAGLGAGVGAGGAGGEAGLARVRSPALPHRAAPHHRVPDPTPALLLRGGEGSGVSVCGGGAARPARYLGAASLPRGAALPQAPPAELATSLPRGAALPQVPHAEPAKLHHHHHPHAKQVAVVGPHHHHPGAASRVTITSVPAISPQGQMAMGEGYSHFSHQHYQMYQQHFRATQHDSRASPSPYTTRSLEAEGCESPAPPLELRRPAASGAGAGVRGPRPAHSPAPSDRLIMYAAGCGRSPPPAHLSRGSLSGGAGAGSLSGSLSGSLPGPPHASQVPREADSLQMLLRRYPVMWQGLLALKNDSAAVQMHFVGGNPGVAGDTLPRHTDGSTPPLRIAQRMRLEPAQLDQVHRKMKLENEHCILLALPCGRDHMDVLQQSTNLTAGFITYLQRKVAAGIVNVAPPGHQQAMYTVHIFPSCDFANENLNRIAPDLMHRVTDIAHLLIVIATV